MKGQSKQTKTTYQLLQWRFLHSSIPRNLGVLHEHMSSRNPDAGKLNPTVINSVAAHLLANVANVHPGHQAIVLWITQLYNERFDSVTLTFDDELCKDDTACLKVSKDELAQG